MMMKNGNWKIKGKYVEAKIGLWNLEFLFSCFESVRSVLFFFLCIQFNFF